jgi:hypothetical protein
MKTNVKKNIKKTKKINEKPYYHKKATTKIIELLSKDNLFVYEEKRLRSALVAYADYFFSKFIRERDRENGCISQ